MDFKNKKNDSILFLILMVAAALVMFSGLNGSLRDWDESVYAQAAKESLNRPDWYNLYWNGSPWIDKPPLMIWAIRFVYEIFGVGQWQARLPSAFCGWLLAGVVCLFGMRAVSSYTGILSGIILIGTPHFVKMGKMGQLDVPVALFITLSLYIFYLAVENKNSRLFLLSGFFTGCAVMTKWTVGLFPLIIQTALMFMPQYRRLYKDKLWWLGILAAAFVALPWVIQQYCVYGTVFSHHFLGIKMVASVNTQIAGHGGGFFYYLEIMFNKSRPWCFFYIPVFIFLIRQLYLKDKFSVFILFWASFIFGLFSLAKTKLHWYIMPFYPAVSLSIGYFFNIIIKKYNYRLLVLTLALAVIPAHIFFSRDYIKLDLNPEMLRLVKLIEQDIKQYDSLFVYKSTFAPSLMFYTNKKVTLITDEADLLKILNINKNIIIICYDKNYNEIESFIKNGIVQVNGNIMYSDKFVVSFLKNKNGGVN